MFIKRCENVTMIDFINVFIFKFDMFSYDILRTFLKHNQYMFIRKFSLIFYTMFLKHYQNVFGVKQNVLRTFSKCLMINIIK